MNAIAAIYAFLMAFALVVMISIATLYSLVVLGWISEAILRLLAGLLS